MRELKFKVWDKVKQNIYKLQAISFDTQGLTPFAISLPGRSWEPVGKFELLQWTGLLDANGIEVYEGDFIKITANLYQVTWNETTAGFVLLDLEDSSHQSISDVALGNVVGNIFQNPEISLRKS